MLDIAVIREKPDWVKAQIEKLNDPGARERIDTIIKLDAERRVLLVGAEALQAERNKLNKSMGRLHGVKAKDPETAGTLALRAVEAITAGDYTLAVNVMAGKVDVITDATLDAQAALDTLVETLREMGDKVNALRERIREVEAELQANMLWIPNLPHESVPLGAGDADNVPWPPEGEFREFDFTPKPHWELGPALGIIDFERGVKLAGTRAYVFKGIGARLQRALEAFFLDMAREKGFQEVYVPFFVREAALVGAAQFPKFQDVVYFDPDAEVYMLPTAEVAITNMHADEILDEADLPLYYVGDTPCFRRERASAGRETRGIKRVHQFQKVEMYKFTTPETSYAELEALVDAACDIARKMAIPFRRLEISTGDLGFSAAKKYDVEMWAPGSEEWLEVSSCSNTEAFQARRANIRYRPEGEKRTQFVHTLNGSGLATPRVMIAILENYQQSDGSVVVPEVLRPYLGGLEVITGPNA